MIRGRELAVFGRIPPTLGSLVSNRNDLHYLQTHPHAPNRYASPDGSISSRVAALLYLLQLILLAD